MSNKAVSATYRTIIDDVIANVRQDFEDMGIEREILEELQRSWEAKIIATCVAEFDGAAEAPSAAAVKGARKAKEKEVKPNAKHEADKAEKAALALNGGGNAEAGPSNLNGTGSGAGEASRKAVRTESGKVATSSLFTSSSEAPPTPQETRAGEKRKRAQATDEITSDLDDSDEEGDEPGEVEGEDMVLCLYDKVQRVKNKWKCVLKDGVASIDGRDYVFSKLTSDFEW